MMGGLTHMLVVVWVATMSVQAHPDLLRSLLESIDKRDHRHEGRNGEEITVEREFATIDKRENGVSKSDQDAILNAHNKIRAGVKPTASDMVKMYWDFQMASKAQVWANSCPSGHDSNEMRRIAGYGMAIGQNMAWGYADWDAAIMGWHSEVKDFTYGVGKSGNGAIGHFTQEVNAKAGRVGCGYNGGCSKKTYVCNYAYGQTPDEMKKPYKSGPSCGECGSKCQDKLCDCKGKLCKNGGTLDVATCQCKCGAVYKGDDCAEINCPPADPSYCGKEQPAGYPKSFCDKFSNVPDECPFMCGVCGFKKRHFVEELRELLDLGGEKK